MKSARTDGPKVLWEVYGVALVFALLLGGLAWLIFGLPAQREAQWEAGRAEALQAWQEEAKVPAREEYKSYARECSYLLQQRNSEPVWPETLPASWAPAISFQCSPDANGRWKATFTNPEPEPVEFGVMARIHEGPSYTDLEQAAKEEGP